MDNRNQNRVVLLLIFCLILIVLGMFLTDWSFVHIVWLPILCLYAFCVFVCVYCAFFSFFNPVFLFACFICFCFSFF